MRSKTAGPFPPCPPGFLRPLRSYSSDQACVFYAQTRQWLETGQCSVLGLTSVAHPNNRTPSVKLTPAGPCGTERASGGTSVVSRAQPPDRRRLIYFSNTFSICPTFFSTLPVFFSALPSACKFGLFVILPAVSLTLPFTS